MSPLNSNKLKNFHFPTSQNNVTITVQKCSVFFSSFFNLCSDVLSILLKMSVLSFFFFLYAVYNNVQVSSPSFFSFHLFSIVLYVFVFVFIFFFHNKLLIQCPFFFFNLISTSICPYLNTITIGLLPSLFNFSLEYHKLSLIYNKTFSIAYEHSSFFFLCTKYPGFFFSK